MFVGYWEFVEDRQGGRSRGFGGGWRKDRGFEGDRRNNRKTNVVRLNRDDLINHST